MEIGSTPVAIRGLFAVCLLLTLALAVSALTAGSAGAAVAIKSFEATPSTTQAGGHPNVIVRFSNENRVEPVNGDPCQCNTLRDANISLPAGLIGNPHATPQCSTLDFSLDTCPVDSQVGVANASVLIFDNCCLTMKVPLYNLVPLPEQAALLGFKAFLFDYPTYTVLSARTGSDYGLDAKVSAINQTFGLTKYEQVLWGVPAAPINDGERFVSGGAFPTEPPTTSNSPEIPFLQNPTTCSGPLVSHLEEVAYDHDVTHAEATWPATTGCDQLSFRPSLSAAPSTRQTDTASGLDVDLKVPQILNPSTPSASEIRSATITLPSGFSINPNAADGKTSCSDAEARFGTEEEAHCPEVSKVGTLSLTSSALPGPMPGNIYLGEPRPGDRYRLILTADGYATHVKLPGSIEADPVSGQLVTSFKDLPQTPFSEFDLHFFGSERGLLATPTACGTYPVESSFVPWDSQLPDQTSTQFFSLTSGPGGSPCPGAVRPFAPEFAAASRRNSAGVHSPFSLELTRPDGDQLLKTLTVKTPPGFSATLNGIPYCSDAILARIAASGASGVTELAAPSCPAASAIGTATAGAGAGTHPIYLPGRVYLAGPYKGAPVSLAVVTPAVSGPYDLGNVVVRAALDVDRSSAQITAMSDPLPRILEGIPLRLRSILVNLDRPNFTLNPTNCEPFAVSAAIGGDQGGAVTPSVRFQTADCDTLGFAPKLRIKLSSAKRRGHPALKAVLRAGNGEDANIKRAVVSLPHSMFIDNSRIKNICTRVQFAAGRCPASSVLGTATATTPLLSQPLQGPVILRANGGARPLPDLVAVLKGPAEQPIEIDLVGAITSVKGAFRSTFAGIPDTAVSKFVLNLQGGKKGLLINSKNLCKKRNVVKANITGQNGVKVSRKPRLQTPCPKPKNRHRAGHRAGGER
jgi:hypothetical protein